jgi:hypothetical protein
LIYEDEDGVMKRGWRMEDRKWQKARIRSRCHSPFSIFHPRLVNGHPAFAKRTVIC